MVKIFSSKWRVAAVGIAVLLVLFLLRPGASRLKSRIIASMSANLGRAVDIGAVHFRLLPRPGFDLENLVVYDDPAFGAEPMLRASDVTASLRLMSLLRGRLEIGRLELTEPSLNLVHGINGGWNLEALVERSAHLALAPTGKAKSEPRQGFPYIEATSARINFKQGPEKTPYALTNADFSLWQDSENTWGVRLKAQPVRTDLNLNDTGVLQVNGRWHRAERIRDTPVEINLEWSRAQLGQMSKLFTGNDRGWRGDVQLDITVSGTPANLEIQSNAAVKDFRRFDIESKDALTLAAHCGGHYSSPEHLFQEVACNAPVGSGQITLKGTMDLANRTYDVSVSAEDVPASAGMMLAQRVKKNLPEDLIAEGTLHGNASFKKDGDGAEVRIEGRGAIADFQLTSAANKAEIGPVSVPFVLSSAAKRTGVRKDEKVADSPHLAFGPFSLAGRGAAPTISGWVDRTGYEASVTGETDIGKSLRTARMLGLAALQTNAEGTADLALDVNGAWAGFTAPQVTGTAKLRNVRVEIRGTAGPAEILSTELHLTSYGVQVEKLNAKAGGTLWTGSLDMPRGCGTPDACELHFNLNANQISLVELGEWAKAKAKERAWYDVLDTGTQDSSGQTKTSFFGSLRASGHVSADRFVVKDLTSAHMAANVIIKNGKINVSELTADFLGGKYHAEWNADFTVKPAMCDGRGVLTGISLAQAAQAMKEGHATGTANGSYELKAPCSAEFWAAADGALEFNVQDGAVPALSLGSEGPLRISHLSGQIHLAQGAFEIKDAELNSPSGNFHLSGTASSKNELDLKLSRATDRSGGGYAISGTLAAPRVHSLSGNEQVTLKTEPAK